jgi:S1-C subfamily serine protease
VVSKNKMRHLLTIVLLLPLASVNAQSNQSKSANLDKSVVKIFSTVSNPDATRPWTKQAPRESSGSGVIIEGKRILTNAHVVLNANIVEVQANQSSDKISATITAIAPDIDLAVLTLDDESLFDSRPPMSRASVLPQIKDEVMAYGFPLGGSSLSITKGIVSRIEFVGYNGSTSGLRIQVDAAINPGNSGGPTVANNKMIGLAFSGLNNAQNIGYIIPNEEIELFLTDIADGKYIGKPAMFDELQTLESPALRTFLKIDKSVEGMVVHQPYLDSSDYPLKEWDVITHIGGTPIDNQGMVKQHEDLRVNFRYLVQSKAKDGNLPLSIVRSGKSLSIKLPVSVERSMLVMDRRGEHPPYFVYGPIVFSKATGTLLSLLINNAGISNAMTALGNPLFTQRMAAPTEEREELVVIASPFFPHKLSKGYRSPIMSTVNKINGISIKSLAHLVTVLRDIKDEFVVIEFDQRGGESLVFPHKEMLEATDKILIDNGVRAQGSPEMLAVWKQKESGQ